MAFYDDELGRAWRSMPSLWKSSTTTITTRRSEHGAAPDDLADSVSAARGAAKQGDAGIDEAMDALEISNRLLSDALDKERHEFAAYRRRVENDHEEAVFEGKAQFLKALLPALDGLERVMANEQLSEPMSAIVSKLGATLDGLGAVEHVASPGDEFDPAIMHAIAVVADESIEPGKVSEMVASGWTMGGKTLRPIQVVVSQTEE